MFCSPHGESRADPREGDWGGSKGVGATVPLLPTKVLYSP